MLAVQMDQGITEIVGDELFEILAGVAAAANPFLPRVILPFCTG